MQVFSVARTVTRFVRRMADLPWRFLVTDVAESGQTRQSSPYHKNKSLNHWPRGAILVAFFMALEWNSQADGPHRSSQLLTATLNAMIERQCPFWAAISAAQCN